MFRVAAFDCFGTVFDASGLPRELVAAYVEHVNAENFSPFEFPQEWYELPAHPDSAEGIRRLRAGGIRCVTLSNGSKELLEALSNRAGIEWDAIIDLAAHRVYKPNQRAYRTVELETGATPGESLLVTANKTFGDVEGASSIGMGWILIRQPEEFWPASIVEFAELLGF